VTTAEGSSVSASPAGPGVTLSESEPQLTIIRPRRGWQAVDLPGVWHFRELLFTLASRDLKLRYKQTALGVIWVILQPLAASGVLAFVFGAVAKLSTDGVPPFLFTFAGMLGWNLFSNTLTKTSTSLVGNSHLISKVFFPRLILPLSTVPSVMVDFGVTLAMLAILMIFTGVAPTWTIILLPLWMIVLLMFALGIGLITAALTVSYRDVQYILPVALQILFFASPIGYAVAAVAEHLRPWYRLNPLAAPIEAFRASLLPTTHPPAIMLLYSFAISAAVFVIGLFTFKSMERKFADVI
jgi:lipopolysaccharide transport system permease protein